MFCLPDSVILQPETLCNLDCSYCYLPFRREQHTMSTTVARAVAASIRPWTSRQTVEVCWHGGEPLATGRKKLGLLLDCFDDLNIAHGIQTNATLIDPAWCAFFGQYNVHVGVSIDGWPEDTRNRVDLRGRPAYGRIMQGIEALQAADMPFSIIAVVSDPTPTRAQTLFDFAVKIGCTSLGVNIAEQEGVNLASNQHEFSAVVAFWAALARAWQQHPVVSVRELDRALSYVTQVLQGTPVPAGPTLDLLPTVAYDGSVTLISPELAGFARRSTASWPVATCWIRRWTS